MGNKTLSDCFDGRSLNGQVFKSSVDITIRGHKFYVVEKIVGNNLRVFPVDFRNEEYVPEKDSVGILYWQHKEDRVCASL